MNKDEALKLALEVLNTAHLVVEDDMLADEIHKAAQACEQALAAPVQPGRNHYEDGDVFERIAAMKKPPAAQPAVPNCNTPTYCQSVQRCTADDANRATPPAAQPAPVPLTDEQIDRIIKTAPITDSGYVGWILDQRRVWARAIEAAHGITAAPEKGQP
jgi:hypothetical protein